MPWFRKRPVVVEAQQYLCDEPAQIQTLEGNMKVSPGDWIITGVKGEKYACKDDIFHQTYEPVKRGQRMSEDCPPE